MPNDESIADLAYRLWVARGQPHGSADDDWQEAERQLQRAEQSPAPAASQDGVDTSLEETFPASDPPASHSADRPPSNASAKWDAAAKKAPRGKDVGLARKKSSQQETPVDESDA